MTLICPITLLLPCLHETLEQPKLSEIMEKQAFGSYNALDRCAGKQQGRSNLENAGF